MNTAPTMPAPSSSPHHLATGTGKGAYHLYLLLCRGGVIYTGITTDVERRYQQHCSGQGARFTRSHPPERLLCHVQAGDRSSAQKLEYQVKQLPKSKKTAFVEGLQRAAAQFNPLATLQN